jgi:hypothetical protein
MISCEDSPFGSKNANGYYITRRKHNGPNILIHRMVWERHNGLIPKGIFVCHICDNPSCINITHLFLGTNSDNMKDMYAKGRGNNFKGENNPIAKLNYRKVDEIRVLLDTKLTQAEIAERYAVDRTLISLIKNNKIWKQEKLNK